MIKINFTSFVLFCFKVATGRILFTQAVMFCFCGHCCSCCLRKTDLRDFPSGLVVRIRRVHGCGPGAIPGWGSEIPQAVWCGQREKEKQV